MKKRILAVLLIVCMAVCLAPFSVLANEEESGEKTKITSLTITIDDPELGTTPSFNIQFNRFKAVANAGDGEGIENAVTVQTEKGSMNAVNWYSCHVTNYTGQKSDIWTTESTGGTISARYYYRMRGVLTPKEGYEFDENIVCTVNGKECTNLYDDIYVNSNKVIVNYLVEPLHYSEDKYTLIKHITAEITEPIIGQTPANLPSLCSSTPEECVSPYYIIWRKMTAEDYKTMKEWNDTPHEEDEICPWFNTRLECEWVGEAPFELVYTEKFEEGYVYQAEITFFSQQATDEKQRVFDENVTATLNGKEYDNQYEGYYYSDYSPNEAVFYLEFAPTTEEESPSSDIAPATGDNTGLVLRGAFVAFMGAALMLLKTKKRAFK